MYVEHFHYHQFLTKGNIALVCQNDEGGKNVSSMIVKCISWSGLFEWIIFSTKIGSRIVASETPRRSVAKCSV